MFLFLAFGGSQVTSPAQVPFTGQAKRTDPGLFVGYRRSPFKIRRLQKMQVRLGHIFAGEFQSGRIHDPFGVFKVNSMDPRARCWRFEDWCFVDCRLGSSGLGT